MRGVPIQLAAEAVHVWHTELNLKDEVLADARRMLSQEERDRAARFRIPGLELNFTAAHAFLRQVLGSYLGVEPGDLRFSYSLLGKPELDGRTELHFNLSHSGNLAVAAIAFGRAVGIDIEIVRDTLDVLGLARRFFAAEEFQRIEALPAAQRLPLFFTLWTCKEAYLKALGVGLTGALDDFAISVSEENGSAHIRPLRTGQSKAWTLQPLFVDPRAAAAIVAHGVGLTVHCARWNWLTKNEPCRRAALMPY